MKRPYNALYQFDGTDWKVKEDSRLVVVTPADYDAMGSPGSHDNFSTSDAPENYLPQFLAQKISICPGRGFKSRHVQIL